MSLENVFYIMAIFYMTLGIIILIVLVVAVFYIKQKITEMERMIKEKIDIISEVAAHPGEAAVGLGAAMAGAAVEKIKVAFDKKRSRKKS